MYLLANINHCHYIRIMDINVYVYGMYMHMYVYVICNMYMYMLIIMYMYICMYLYIYLCIYIIYERLKMFHKIRSAACVGLNIGRFPVQVSPKTSPIMLTLPVKTVENKAT